MKLRLAALALLAVGYLVAGTGCANNKSTAERESLLSQNKDLTSQLEAEKAAHQADQAKIDAMTRQLTAAPAASEGPSTPGMGVGPMDLSSGGGRITRPGTGSGGGATTPVRTAAPKTRSKVTIPGQITFDTGKSTLSAAATKTLDTIAATIKKSHSGDPIVVEGYSDATPVKTASALKSNEALATARANAVKAYLVKKGLPASEMTVKSYTNATSRRVEVAVMAEK
ncbi:MAG TPA: OmpA family protein [Phycisphaerae bacterium]|jgi:flagellar motor protein MotB|nr:OmpA family protein [Phycisphaerae bacterium]